MLSSVSMFIHQSMSVSLFPVFSQSVSLCVSCFLLYFHSLLSCVHYVPWLVSLISSSCFSLLFPIPSLTSVYLVLCLFLCLLSCCWSTWVPNQLKFLILIRYSNFKCIGIYIYKSGTLGAFK